MLQGKEPEAGLQLRGPKVSSFPTSRARGLCGMGRGGESNPGERRERKGKRKTQEIKGGRNEIRRKILWWMHETKRGGGRGKWEWEQGTFLPFQKQYVLAF